MKFRFISVQRETFKVGRMCKLLNVSCSGFHAWFKRPECRRKRESRALKARIRVLHAASHGIYGAPRIHRDLTDDGVRCGKNRVARIMRNADIRSRMKKKFKATTNSKHNFPVAPNLLNQNFKVDTPDHTWVGDITYVPTNEGWLYLAVLLDLFNRGGGRLVYLLQNDPSVGHRCDANGPWSSKSGKGTDTPHGSRQPVCFDRLSENPQRA